MENIATVLAILNLIVLICSVLLIWRTLKTSHEWNRRKTSQEILDKFITGEIPDLNTTLKIEYGCKIYDESTSYGNFLKTLKDQKRKEEFDDTLVKMLNIFEVIAIDMKNSIVDEEICYDYLAWFYTAYFVFSKDFIERKRKDADDPRVLINFEDYAEKWITKKDDELKKHSEKLKIKGKGKL